MVPPWSLPHPKKLPTPLSYALCFEGRKRVRHADDMMARITAERLVRHLERCGFVLMKKPGAKMHSAPAPYR